MKRSPAPSKKEALLRLMKLCSRSEKSTYEIKMKLKNWGLETHAKEIIDQLQKENFLDDSRYARAFVHDKILLNKWGRIKIRYQLIAMGIPDSLVENELASFESSKYEQMVFEELARKKNLLKNLQAMQLKIKLYAFGKQRGYETEIIRKFIDDRVKL